MIKQRFVTEINRKGFLGGYIITNLKSKNTFYITRRINNFPIRVFKITDVKYYNQNNKDTGIVYNGKIYIYNNAKGKILNEVK